MATKTISLKLPEELDRRISEEATRVGVAKSELIRVALVRYLGPGSGKRSSSFFALARDLAGRVNGPRDLSHHPKHLRGFGR